MLLAGFFATALFIGLVVGDWLYFIRLTPYAIRYGYRVADRSEQWPNIPLSTVRERFTPHGVLILPHGVARFYPELSQIAIRPQYRFFSKRFRTAWPVKGLIHLVPHDHALGTLCVKRIPWSSTLITFLWFALVAIGSLTFVVQYAMEGGFASLGGAGWARHYRAGGSCLGLRARHPRLFLSPGRYPPDEGLRGAARDALESRLFLAVALVTTLHSKARQEMVVLGGQTDCRSISHQADDDPTMLLRKT